MSRDCFLYWIHRPCETDITKEGYVGITVNPKARFKAHLAKKNKIKNHKLYNSLRKHDDFIFDIILVGSVPYCLDLEFKLRDKPNIGLNHAIGGINTLENRLRYKFDSSVKEKISEGVKTAFLENPEYRAKVKLRNKGKVKTEETRIKMSIAHKGKSEKWLNSFADLEMWKLADHYYLNYLQMIEICSNRKRSFSPKVFSELTKLPIGKIITMLKAFQSGWVPALDANWIQTFKFKE